MERPMVATQTAAPAAKIGLRTEIGVLAPACMTVFMGLLWATGLGPFLPAIAADLNTSVALVGQVMTAALVMVAVSGLISGPLADHIGHRRSISIGLAIITASAAVMALAPNYPILLAGGIIGGLGGSMTHGVAFGVVAERFSGDAQRKAVSYVQASATSANILGAPILTSIAAVTLWRGSYLFVAAMLLLTVYLVRRGISATPMPETSFSPRGVLSAYRPLLAERRTMTIYGASLLRSMGWMGPMLYIGAFYIEQLGFSIQEVGFALMVTGAGIFSGNLLAGGRLGVFNLRLLFAATTAMLSVALILIFTAPTGPFLTVGIAGVSAFITGVSFTALTALLASESPAGSSTTMVLNMSVLAAGGALGAAIGGVFVSVFGFSALGLVFPVFLLGAAALALTGYERG